MRVNRSFHPLKTAPIAVLAFVLALLCVATGCDEISVEREVAGYEFAFEFGEEGASDGV